jgi:drug/metabolite transporter (DMT)-like permease
MHANKPAPQPLFVETVTAPSRQVNQVKNRIFIALVVTTNSFGNLLLAMGMQSMPDFRSGSVFHYVLTLFTNAEVIAGTVLLVIYMIAQLSMYSWADLSYVLPVTASAYIITTLLGKFVLGEHITALRWIGVVIISFGVVLVAETPPMTHPKPKEGIE